MMMILYNPLHYPAFFTSSLSASESIPDHSTFSKWFILSPIDGRRQWRPYPVGIDYIMGYNLASCRFQKQENHLRVPHTIWARERISLALLDHQFPFCWLHASDVTIFFGMTSFVRINGTGVTRKWRHFGTMIMRSVWADVFRWLNLFVRVAYDWLPSRLLRFMSS